MNRRQLRKRLGSRTQRRYGTKTKVIDVVTQDGPNPKYRHWRPQAVRPREKLRRLIEEERESARER